MYNYDRLQEMFKAAASSRRPFDNDLRESYELTLPQEWVGSGLDGNDRDSFGSEQLDAEGGIALKDRTSEIMDKLFPVYAPSIELEHPVGYYQGDLIAQAEHNIYKGMYVSGFYPKMKMFIRSGLLAMGCMEVKASNNILKPFVFRVIPVWNVYPLEDSAGELDRIFIYSELTKWEINRDFDFDISTEASEEGKNKRFGVIEYYEKRADGLTDYYVFLGSPPNTGDGQYTEQAKSEEYNKIIYQEEAAELRGLVPARFDRLINRGFGRGPVMTTLPNLRQLQYLTAQNHDIMELTSKGFLFMNMDEIDQDDLSDTQGITFLHKDPQEKPPELLQFQGSLAYSEEQLRKLRVDINRQIMGPDIPPIDAGVRSAEEYKMRGSQRQMLVTPEIVNFYAEIETNLIPLVLRILNSAKMARSPYALPDAEFDYKPKSRITELESQRRAGQMFVAISQALQMSPDGRVWNVVDKEKMLTEFLRLQKVPSHLMMSERDRKLQALEAERAALEQAQAQGGDNNNAGQEEASPLIAPAQVPLPAQAGGF